MPGRNGYSAVQNYLDPIRNAMGILAVGPTIILGRKQEYDLGSEGYWRLGAEDGLQLKTANGTTAYFQAEQAFKIVDVDPATQSTSLGKFRVTTLMYAYELRVDGIVEWQMHWHPQGKSPETRPHYHFARRPGAHLPCARHTIEDAVEWCIEGGAVPTREDWAPRLLKTKEKHEEHRTWTDSPTGAAQKSQ